MTINEPTPGSTPPPTWATDPVASTPVNPVPVAAPTSFAPAPLVASTTPKKNRASTGTALLLVGALVAIGGVAFAVGRVTAPTPAATTGGFAGAGRGTGTGEGGTGFGAAGGFGGAGRTGGGVSITGTVVSVSASSIEIKLAAGNTMTLNLSTNVTYRDSTTGSAADVTPGATVQVGLALAGGAGPTASGNPRPSGGFGGAGLANASVGTITVVK